MSYKVESLGNGRAKMVIRLDGGDLFTLPPAEIRELLKDSGLLLFRGFNLPAEDLERFAGQYSSQFVHEGGRQSLVGHVEHVDVGKEFMALHAEIGVTPFRPDLVFFCCMRTATVGGQTTFCDGVDLWHELSESTRQAFLEKNVKYSRNYTEEKWKRFAFPDGTIENLAATLAHVPGTSFRHNEDNSIDTEYTVSAVPQTRYGPPQCFANSVLGAYAGAYFGITMSFEDDTEIPLEILQEIEATAERLTEDIPWEDGDVAMFDNSRVMHGRRAFLEDERRQLYSCLSMANF